MSNSSNLALPFLQQAQAQKHITVNESLLRLDALVQLAVVSAALNTEPSTPDDGALYILPAGKTGAAWDAMANGALAYYRDGVWEEITPKSGWRAFVRDAPQFYAYDGASWRAEAALASAWRVLAASAVAVSHTGDTDETALASIDLPGGAMGPNGALRVSTQWGYTNSANSKTKRYRLGGLGGSTIMAITANTSASAQHQRTIQNRNAEDAQVSAGAGFGNSFGMSGNTPATTAIDTSADQTLVISGQLANAGETLTLESYLVEVCYRA
jgi:hypothetical protein